MFYGVLVEGPCVDAFGPERRTRGLVSSELLRVVRADIGIRVALVEQHSRALAGTRD